MEKGAKSSFEIWASSFYDKTTFPSSWNNNMGLPIELWFIEKTDKVSLYYSKHHIIHRVNEDMYGGLPIWHVWNLRTDKHVYCGQNQQEAYTVYQQEIEKERSHDRN
ncbi:MAG: hypothetical protein IKN04_03315 [Clostridia bacterium]|nr:hypothetical protein [Clostridia bacterium]